jgi:hypothetical protein
METMVRQMMKSDQAPRLAGRHGGEDETLQVTFLQQ